MILTVVIPCYNVAASIEEVIRKLPDNFSWIIEVNDDSKDNTKNQQFFEKMI